MMRESVVGERPFHPSYFILRRWRAKMRKRPSWIRYSGLGIEFAAAVGGCTLVGYWIDRHYECRPWGILIGAMVGLIGGMYNLIRESLAAAREAQRRSEADREDDS